MQRGYDSDLLFDFAPAPRFHKRALWALEPNLGLGMDSTTPLKQAFNFPIQAVFFAGKHAFFNRIMEVFFQGSCRSFLDCKL